MATHDDNQNPEMKTRKLTLRSSDGRNFLISQSAAILSATVKNMLENDSAREVITVPNVKGETLANVIAYLNKHAEDGVSDDEKKKFDQAFLSEAKGSVLLDVMSAAEYLNITGLVDMVAGKIAHVMTNKSVEWVRKTFGIESDLKPQEEEQLKQEYPWAFEDVEPDEDDEEN